jgi:hypothetical protein
MAIIDLVKTLKTAGISDLEVARELFPSNRYPLFALNRILRGKALLNSAQLSRLALLCGCSVTDLYEPTGWISERGTRSLAVFTRPGYRAELDLNTMVTRLFADDQLAHTETITSRSLPVEEYLKRQSEIIEELKTKTK